VIKFAVGPLHGVVALLARDWEARMGYWRRGIVVSGLVATDARRRCNAVVVVDVTVAALPWRYGVRASQRESGLRVIECRRLPCRSVVAGVAGLGKSAGDVVRVRCVLKIPQVTRHTVLARQVVVIVAMTIAALPGRDRVRAS